MVNVGDDGKISDLLWSVKRMHLRRKVHAGLRTAGRAGGAYKRFRQRRKPCEGAIHLPRGNKIKGGAPARASALVGERLPWSMWAMIKISDFLVGQKIHLQKMGNGQVYWGVPQEIPADRRRGQAPALQNRVMIGAPAGAPGLQPYAYPRRPPWNFRGMAPMAARRAHPVQRSRSQGLRGNRDTCRPRRGVVGPSYGSFASGRPESSFPPLGLLSPPNPLRWASAGAPVTASASQWGRRQCAVGLRPVRTAHRRREPRFGGRRGNTPGPFFPPISSGRNGAPAASEAPGALPIKIQRSHLQKSGASREGAPTDKHRAVKVLPWQIAADYGPGGCHTALRTARQGCRALLLVLDLHAAVDRSPVLWMICSRDWYRPG